MNFSFLAILTLSIFDGSLASSNIFDRSLCPLYNTINDDKNLTYAMKCFKNPKKLSKKNYEKYISRFTNCMRDIAFYCQFCEGFTGDSAATEFCLKYCVVDPQWARRVRFAGFSSWGSFNFCRKKKTDFEVTKCIAKRVPLIKSAGESVSPEFCQSCADRMGFFGGTSRRSRQRNEAPTCKLYDLINDPINLNIGITCGQYLNGTYSEILEDPERSYDTSQCLVPYLSMCAEYNSPGNTVSKSLYEIQRFLLFKQWDKSFSSYNQDCKNINVGKIITSVINFTKEENTDSDLFPLTCYASNDTRRTENYTREPRDLVKCIHEQPAGFLGYDPKCIERNRVQEKESGANFPKEDCRVFDHFLNRFLGSLSSYINTFSCFVNREPDPECNK